jgi:uncharacterized damage-inducible protein DinB
MTSLSIPRPAPHEAAQFYHGYIAKVPGENIGEQLVDQLSEVERLFGALDDGSALARYAPGKWSIKEVLGHLSDVERIFSYRLLRIGRGDPTPLPGFDENAYVPAAGFDERPLRDLAAEFRAVRLSSMALTSGLPATSWSQMGHVSGKPVSARALAYIIVGHVAHHLGVLRERYGLGAGSASASFAENR